MIYIVDICYYVNIYFNLHASNNNTFELLYFVIYIKCLLNFFMICRSISCGLQGVHFYTQLGFKSCNSNGSVSLQRVAEQEMLFLVFHVRKMTKILDISVKSKQVKY